MSIQNRNNQLCFILEGNIGAGKSTFLRIIKEYLNVQIVYEPLEQWQKIGGTEENLLEKFYADTPRWAYTFQTCAFVTRIMTQQEHLKRNVLPAQVLERSVFSDRYCFAKNAHELGFMTDLEWQLYQEWFSWFIYNYTTKPTAFFYMRTDPEVCYQRLQKRYRHEETGVSFDYIKKLHEKHENWLIKREGVDPFLYDIPVLSLDCNDEFENSRFKQEEHIEKILSFVHAHFNSAIQRGVSSSLPL